MAVALRKFVSLRKYTPEFYAGYCPGFYLWEVRDTVTGELHTVAADNEDHARWVQRMTTERRDPETSEFEVVRKLGSNPDADEWRRYHR